MALQKCPECGGSVSNRAKSCPGCGAPPKRKTSRAAKLFLLMIALVFVGAGISTARNGGPRTAQASTKAKAAPKPEKNRDKRADHESWAWEHAKTLVRSQLKAPRSAKFPTWKWADHVAYRGDGVYECHVPVDAQNGFGAMLRSDFLFRLRFFGVNPHEIREWKVEHAEVR